MRHVFSKGWGLLGLAAAGAMALTSGVQAATVAVYDTTLTNLNATNGAGTATTVDLGGPVLGRVTTTVGPGSGGNRVSAPYVPDQWVQRNVGGNGSVGITNEYARSGNGSAYFAGTGNGGEYKSDLEISFASPIAANSITGFGYDWYRDSASGTTNTAVHPVLRLMVLGRVSAGLVAGYLVFERAYNGGGAAPVDAWVMEALTFTTGNIWGTGTLPGAFSEYGRQLDDWDSLVTSLQVLGMSIGAGSGWNGGGFKGAIDNVYLNTASGSTTWNFEVAAVQVPEPGSIALACLALLGAAAATPRRRA